ncbi:hypothetical protein LEP1GSC108_2876 [Leptospira weilii str. UI 13098]|uniref:Uncharacterized protein n=1 Tax=Leptospira weilii str. UI 13098 TaxID=1088542 RepID=M6Q4R8_9LEPT|nr:hypothetical protein LEP1GSC108_2876 [Leptospira weilii str. UI 13098]
MIAESFLTKRSSHKNRYRKLIIDFIKCGNHSKNGEFERASC